MASGESTRQLKAIAEEVVHSLKQEGVAPLHREGSNDSGWILLDYGDIIVHLFGEEERTTYRLDELWKETKPVLRMQ